MDLPATFEHASVLGQPTTPVASAGAVPDSFATSAPCPREQRGFERNLGQLDDGDVFIVACGRSDAPTWGLRWEGPDGRATRTELPTFAGHRPEPMWVIGSNIWFDEARGEGKRRQVRGLPLRHVGGGRLVPGPPGDWVRDSSHYRADAWLAEGDWMSAMRARNRTYLDGFPARGLPLLSFERAMERGDYLAARRAAVLEAIDPTDEPVWWRAAAREITRRLDAGLSIEPATNFFGKTSEPRPELTAVMRPVVLRIAREGIRPRNTELRYWLDAREPLQATALYRLDPQWLSAQAALAHTPAVSGIPQRLGLLDDRLCLDFTPPRGFLPRRQCATAPRDVRRGASAPPLSAPGCARPRQNGREQACPIPLVGDGCTLDYLGTPLCRGALADGAPSTRGFERLAVASRYACAWGGRRDTMQCWGDLPDDVPASIDNAAQAVVDELFVCALQGDGRVTCWGDAPDVPVVSVPTWLERRDIRPVESGRAGDFTCKRPTVRPLGAYDGGELSLVTCSVNINGPAGSAEFHTLRWVGPDGRQVDSPTAIGDPKGLAIRSEGVGFSLQALLNADLAPVSFMESGTLHRREGFLAYLGDGEFAAATLGPWTPTGGSDAVP